MVLGLGSRWSGGGGGGGHKSPDGAAGKQCRIKGEASRRNKPVVEVTRISNIQLLEYALFVRN